MCLLVESLKIERGRPADLEYHNERFNRSRRELFGRTDAVDLNDHLSGGAGADIPLAKCRVLYRETIEGIEIKPYSRRTVRTLRLVECGDIDYRYKYADKSAFNALLARKGNADDILIVREGLITDTSFSNVVFFDGRRRITPAKPLLRGTKRDKLLTLGIISEGDIRPQDVDGFTYLSLINALIELDEMVLDVGEVRY